jgi:hypothetical protein
VVVDAAEAYGAVTRQTYRRAWAGITRIVLVVGGVVPIAIWAVVSPWTLATILVAGLLVRRLGLSRRSVEALGRICREHVSASAHGAVGIRVLGLLPAFLLAALGWNVVLGGSGTAIVLVDALLGLPLLLVDEAAAAPPLPTVEEPCWAMPVDVVTTTRELDDAAAGFDGWTGPRTLLPDLSDAELWHAWRASSRALDLEPNGQARLLIVSARSRYLDALAERDPEGLARRLGTDGTSDWTPFGFPA